MIDATMNAAMRTFLHDLNENGRGAEARTPGQSIEPGRALSRAHEEATRAGAPVQAAGYVRTPIGCYGSEDAKGRPLCDGPDEIGRAHV